MDHLLSLNDQRRIHVRQTAVLGARRHTVVDCSVKSSPSESTEEILCQEGSQ